MTGAVPEHTPEAFGWRPDGCPHGECVGWTDGDEVYLEPTAAYGVVQRTARDMGETIAVAEAMLRRRFRDKNLLASWDQPRETLTVRRSILKVQKNVLHFSRATLFPQTPDKPDIPDISTAMGVKRVLPIGSRIDTWSGAEAPTKLHLNQQLRIGNLVL